MIIHHARRQRIPFSVFSICINKNARPTNYGLDESVELSEGGAFGLLACSNDASYVRLR